MKTIKYLMMCVAVVILISCQDEEKLVIQDIKQNLSAKSPLASLISRVSQNATSKDNILDKSSCFNVQLPVSVIVNNKQITVSSQNDYKVVQNALDAFSNDDDVVNFVYPIKIQFQNYKTELIANPDQLEDIIDKCDDDDGFDEIDCLQINYPIKINIYNADNQIANSITIQNDKDLYNFLKDLVNNVFISINYPISIINSKGQNVVITNNSNFENSIEEGIKDCNTNSGSVGNQNFVLIVTNGTWNVSYYFDDSDETLNFKGYNFTFNSNGTIMVVKEKNTIAGNWSTFVNSGQNIFLLKFDDSRLDELEDDWKITEFTSTNVRLKNKDASDGATDYLYFTKN